MFEICTEKRNILLLLRQTKKLREISKMHNITDRGRMQKQFKIGKILWVEGRGRGRIMEETGENE